MTRITLLLVVLLVCLMSSSPRVGAADPPAFQSRPDKQISERDAIQIAEDQARRLKIDLEHYEPPSATYISDGYKGKWHVFFIAKSHNFDACFFVDIYRLTERPHFSWCS